MVHGQRSESSGSFTTAFMRLISLVVLTLLFWLTAVPLSAQSNDVTIPLPPAAPNFRLITTDDGLAHSHISAIIQDRFGFFWFGTFNGLNRYDGYRFIRFRHDPDVPTSLSSNNISVVVEGPEGFIWVGTEDGGLNRFSPARKMVFCPALSGTRTI